MFSLRFCASWFERCGLSPIGLLATSAIVACGGLYLASGIESLGGALLAMGVYAVMAHAIGQRTQEFGVRLALGASPADILRLVGREGLKLAALGILAGLALTAAVTRLLVGFLHGVSTFDPVVFLLMSAALLVLVLAATGIPARRATRVDPMVALRNE